LQTSSYNWGTTNKNGVLQGVTVSNSGSGFTQPLSFSQSFGYDHLNRLKTASDSGRWSRSFNYDTYGNMWVTANSGVSLSGNTPQSNVFTTANRISGSGYDGAGNQTSVNGNAAVYDAENRMLSVYDPVANGTETLLYSGLGQRVEKTTTGGTTVYVYDAFGALAAQYATSETASPCTTCYVSSDQVASVRLVTDGAANVVAAA
jgi:YD repeat-containing protein